MFPASGVVTNILLLNKHPYFVSSLFLLGLNFFVEIHFVGKEHCFYLDNQLLLFSCGAFQLILFSVCYKTNGRGTSKYRVLVANETKNIFLLVFI